MLTDDSIQSLGGKARAESLSDEEKTAIAKKAAEARWAIPMETHSGALKIGGIEILCHVLSDGTRLLSQEGVNRGLGRRGRPKAKHEENSGLQLPVFLQANNLQPFVPQDNMDVFKPIRFKRKQGGAYSIGYRAEILPKTCHVFLDAKEAGKLVPSQAATADRCKILSRGLGEVGIIALVDEATGYQDVRDRQALQKILEAYLLKEFAVWAKRFPDEFYKELFRLRGWSWSQLSVARPGYVGKLTNDLVYERLAPGILDELKRKNPKTEAGVRKTKHHQWLTEDIGHPALAQHLHATIALMRASTDWRTFYSMIERALPKKIGQLPLLLDA